MPGDSLAFYTQKLLAREPFSEEDTNGLLQAYHAAHTGASWDEYGNYLTDTGVTTYERLVESIQIKDIPTRIVDLACGDGPLAEIIARRFSNQVKILAIDMSASELEAAKKRLAAFDTIDFSLGTAATMPWESSSVDYVLCHMALMLMRPIDAVFKEVGRILKPGGTLAAIIPQDDGGHDEIQERCCDIMREVRKEYLPHFDTIKLGVPEVCSKKGLDTIALEAGCFFPPAYEDVTLVVTATPQKHFELFSTYYYPPFFPPAGKEKFKQKLMRYLESVQDDNNQVTRRDYLRKVTIKKR